MYLHVDLGSGRARRRAIPPEVSARFVGGAGLATWLCLREGGAEHAPFDPRAPIVFALSPLVGTPLATSAKLAVAARSPLTGLLSDALSSSHFAIAAKRCGIDALVITGRAPGWSRLRIDDHEVELEPAAAWLGRPAEACARDDYATAAIGVAGEHRVRFASIQNDGRHAGRGGLGAVLGAKRLKAIDVRGSHVTPVADPGALAHAARRLAARSRGAATARYRELGTVSNVLGFDRLGALPAHNFRDSGFAGAQALSGEAFHAEHAPQRASCAACSIGCEHRFQRSGGGRVRLEYETLFALGPGLGIADREAVLALAEQCDRLGVDSLSAGGTLACAMEAGFDGLRFGDAAAAGDALERLATRAGSGDALAEGSRRLAAALGRPELAMTVKGLELPGYDPRHLHAMALGFAVGSRGADHNRSGAYQLDFSERVDRHDLRCDDVPRVVEVENRSAALDSLILCKFVRGVFDDFEREVGALLEPVTGQACDVQALGRDVFSLRKLFNQRAGWTAADDTLPARCFDARLTRERLQGWIARYYAERGWSPDGRVTAETERALVGDEAAA